MTTVQIKTLLDGVVELSMQVGALQAQRTNRMYGPQDAIIEHGLRQSLFQKKQKLLEMIVKVSEQ